MALHSKNKVLIVGAGCFGLSTAYHLLKRGFTDVTVIDRSTELPAPDAASCDLNKGAPWTLLLGLVLSTYLFICFLKKWYVLHMQIHFMPNWHMKPSAAGETKKNGVTLTKSTCVAVGMIRSWKESLTSLQKYLFLDPEFF